MKTLEKLKQERQILLKSTPSDMKEYRKISKEVAFLKPLIHYLESNPSEENLRKQLALARKKLDSLHKQCDIEVGTEALQKIRTAWLNKEGAGTLRKQIKNLEFLLA